MVERSERVEAVALEEDLDEDEPEGLALWIECQR